MVHRINKCIAKLLKTVFFTVFYCSTLTSSSQLSLQKDFTLSTPPRIASKNWFMLNHGSAHYFKTDIVDGHLRISRTEFVDSVDFKIPNGRLVGIDNGEWGGNLKFVSLDSTMTEQVIVRGNIRFIFSFAGRIYYIDGIAHGTESSGIMYRFDTSDQQFSSTKVVSFEDAPEALAIWNNKLLIAGHESFFVIDEQLNKEKILSNTFWANLYPTSIAIIDIEHVYIGLRAGIVELNLSTRTFLFYRYNGIKFGNSPVDYNTPMYDFTD